MRVYPYAVTPVYAVDPCAEEKKKIKHIDTSIARSFFPCLNAVFYFFFSHPYSIYFYMRK